MEFKTGPKNVRIMIKVFDMLEQKKKSKQLRTKLFTSMKKADFCKMRTLYLYLFRAIFDLSNKIALLILLRMFALYVKKKQKIEN